MKRLHFLYIIGIALMLTSCHLETSDNGDLDGLWQGLTKVDVITGEVTDLRDYQASWSFQGGMVQMNATTIPLNHVIGVFVKTDSSLKVDKLCIFTHGKGDTPIEDVSILSVFGFTRLDETFQIVELSSDNLVLQTDAVRLTFRKY